VIIALAALSVLALALGVMLRRQIVWREELRRWLGDPDNREAPDGGGRWRDIFSMLQRMRKEDRKARQALSDSLERFRLAAQALPDGIVLLDAEGHIEWMNLAAADHFGLDPARDIGTLIVHLIRQGGFHEFFGGFRAGGDGGPLVLHAGTEGTRRVLSLSLIPFAGTGVLLLSRDIGEIVRTEAMRRDFVANVSHELRTPLTVISGFIEHLTEEETPLDASTRATLALMAEQSSRMTRLVEDLLTLSRLENAPEPPRDDPVDVPALLLALLAEARALSGGRHLIELEEVAPRGMRGSADEIRSAFANLVMNAVRHTPPGGRVGIAWREEDGSLVFSVADNGIGIPAEHIPRLTERFYRVDKGRSASTGGTGLGLAIVKHVLARHKGTLAIRSDVGRGSVFSATFPADDIPTAPSGDKIARAGQSPTEHP
jgi:two-component system phosphate regulon sensor histidine kinase PhoR